MKKLLLIQEKSKPGRTRVNKLEKTGFLVLEADSTNLYWTKFVEAGQWDAIIFDHSSFAMIFMEMATEFGASKLAESTALILISPDRLPDDKLPSPFRSCLQVQDDTELLKTLSKIL